MTDTSIRTVLDDRSTYTMQVLSYSVVLPPLVIKIDFRMYGKGSPKNVALASSDAGITIQLFDCNRSLQISVTSINVFPFPYVINMISIQAYMSIFRRPVMSAAHYTRDRPP